MGKEQEGRIVSPHQFERGTAFSHDLGLLDDAPTR